MRVGTSNPYVGVTSRNSRRCPMFRPIIRLWLLIFVPFAILPLTFLSGLVVPYTALWGHAVFHLIYLPIAAAACWALWRFVREPSHVLCDLRGGRDHGERAAAHRADSHRCRPATPPSFAKSHQWARFYLDLTGGREDMSARGPAATRLCGSRQRFDCVRSASLGPPLLRD